MNETARRRASQVPSWPRTRVIKLLASNEQQEGLVRLGQPEDQMSVHH